MTQREPFKRIGNRISLLPISQFCGLAAKLSEEHGAGRAAAKSSAFHATCADVPEARALFARLTPEEQEEIALWKRPTDITLGGVSLDYASAEKELFVGIDASGEYAEPETAETLTCGSIDFAWVRTVGGQKVAYVADIKKTRWTVEGPTTLQLLAYGWAYAKKHGCTHFVCGLWVAEGGEWIWSDEWFGVEGFDGLDTWQRISFAALNKEITGSTGPHCQSCYGRLHCPEYTYPIAAAEDKLAVISGELHGEIEPARLGEAIALAQQLGDVAEAFLKNAKEAVRRGAKATNAKGQIYKPIAMPGRESMNVPKLLQEYPEATRFITKGNGYSQFRWSKP